jgi:hypothetical protein
MPTEILQIRDHLGNQGIDKGLLKYILKTPGVKMRTGPYDTVSNQRRSDTNKAINFRNPSTKVNLLTHKTLKNLLTPRSNTVSKWPLKGKN